MSILNLPDEILASIFSHFEIKDLVKRWGSAHNYRLHHELITDPPLAPYTYNNLLNLCLTCKRFRPVAQQAMFRKIEIIDTRKAKKLLWCLRDSPRLRLLVRELSATIYDTIIWWEPSRVYSGSGSINKRLRWMDLDDVCVNWPATGEAYYDAVMALIKADRDANVRIDTVHNTNFYYTEDQAALLDNGYLNPDGDILSHFQANICQYLYAALIALLPNLEDLTFSRPTMPETNPIGRTIHPPYSVQQQGRLDHLLQTILASQSGEPGQYEEGPARIPPYVICNEEGSPVCYKALSRLRSVAWRNFLYKGDLIRNEHPADLRYSYGLLPMQYWVNTLCALPSMRSITCDFNYPTSWSQEAHREPLPSKNIHTLHTTLFQYRRYPAFLWTRLGHLLAHPNALRRFTLDFAPREADGENYTTPKSFTFAELLHPDDCSALEYLHLQANKEFGGLIKLLQWNDFTLSSLPSLRHLKISGNLWACTQCEDGQEHTYPFLQHQGDAHNAPLWQVTPERDLGSILPTNIESFGFREVWQADNKGRPYGSFNDYYMLPEMSIGHPGWPFNAIDRSEYDRWFLGMWASVAVAKNQGTLPNLKRVAVMSSWFYVRREPEQLRGRAALVDLFAQAGLELLIIEDEDRETWDEWCWHIPGIED